MGIDPKSLKDNQLDMIADPKQRKEVVKKRGLGETAAQVKAKTENQRESDLHDQYISFLRRHELAYVHANPVKPATIQRGQPDFTVTGGERYAYRSMYGEFKLPGNTLAPVQQERIGYLRLIGCMVFIWYDYETAIKDTAQWFKINLPCVANDANIGGEYNVRDAVHPD
jgi:hypothetical protein